MPNIPLFKVSGKVIIPFSGGMLRNDGSLYRGITQFWMVPLGLRSQEQQFLVPPRTSTSISDSEGEVAFEIGGLPAGSYHMFPVFTDNVSDGALPGTLYTGRTLLHIVNSDVDNLVIPIRPNSTIEGRIVHEGQLPLSSLASIQIELRPAERFPAILGIRFRAAIDNETLAFTFSDVPEGKFALFVSGLPETSYIADIHYGTSSIMNDGVINVAYGREQNLEILWNTVAAEVRGTVTDFGNRPVSGATVILTPNFPLNRNVLLYRRVTTDESGRYAIPGVAPGDYRLFAWQQAPPISAELDPEFLAPYGQFSRATTVSRGLPAFVEIRLAPDSP